MCEGVLKGELRSHFAQLFLSNFRAVKGRIGGLFFGKFFGEGEDGGLDDGLELFCFFIGSFVFGGFFGSIDGHSCGRLQNAKSLLLILLSCLVEEEGFSLCRCCRGKVG